MSQTVHILSDTLPALSPDVAYLAFTAIAFMSIGFALCLLTLKIVDDVKGRKKDKEQNNY